MLCSDTEHDVGYFRGLPGISTVKGILAADKGIRMLRRISLELTYFGVRHDYTVLISRFLWNGKHIFVGLLLAPRYICKRILVKYELQR